MTFFMGDREPNSILPAETPGSEGPSTGFTENFSAAYNEQAHVRSAFGADEDMATLEQQQLDKLYHLSGERMSPLFPGVWSNSQPTEAKQFSILHSLAGDTLDSTQQQFLDASKKQIDKYNKLASEHGLLTYDQMFKQVQQQAQQYVTDAGVTASRQNGLGGWLGSVAGGIAGSFTMRDPTNIATLALGGIGKTAIARIASEVGIAGVSQAAQLLTGGYENQELLGQAPTGGEVAGQIAETALGAGIIRGGGEAAAAGFRAIASRFGSRAADVTAGAVAHEAEQAIGPSPYGTSRTAQGMHEAEVLDALQKDVPMNVAVKDMPADASPFAASNFATSATDNLFAGTDRPLDNIFDNVPKTKVMQQANRLIKSATDRIADTDAAVADLGLQIHNREADLLPPRELADRKAQLATLDQQIAAESNLRKLGQLNKDRAALSEVIGRQEQISRDLDALAQKRASAAAQADNLRTARASLVEDAARKAPSVSRSATVRGLLGDVNRSRPMSGPSPTRAASEQVEKDLAAPVKKEPKAAKVIPAAEPNEAGKLPKGAVDHDMVELGQKSGPADLDMPVHLGDYDAEGKPIMTTIRQALQDHADDDALVRQMNECLL